MSFIGKTIGKVVGGITGASQQADAIKEGAATQAAAAQQGINQQNAALEAFRQQLAPYVNAGTGALSGQQDLLGLNGADAQKAAIGALQNSPQFQALSQQGNDAILANASATGGLRGGNVQAALAQFQPALLSQLIDQQYARLGGLTSIGQNSAAGVGNAGLQTGSNIAQLLQQQGAATAGGQIAQGSVPGQAFGSLLGIGGLLGGLFGGKGGAPAASAPAASPGFNPLFSSAGNYDFVPPKLPVSDLIGGLPTKF